MKRALLAPAAAVAFGFALLASPAASAGAPQLNPPKKNGPKIHKKVTPQKKNNNKAGTQDPTELAKSTTSTGVIKNMRIGKSGEIIEIYIKLAGNTRTARVEGCGAKSANHPLLNWAFQNKRLVYLHADHNSCFANVIVSQ